MKKKQTNWVKWGALEDWKSGVVCVGLNISYSLWFNNTIIITTADVHIVSFHNSHLQNNLSNLQLIVLTQYYIFNEKFEIQND